MSPLITIGMPVYMGGRGDGRLLKRALDSLFNQTFQDFQVIMVDNASPDDTARIVKKLVKNDPRFAYHRHPVNMGVVYSFARLVTACDSKYFLELHFDSHLAPTYLEECLNILEADQGAVIAYSYCQFVDQAGNLLDVYKDTADFTHEDPGQRYLNLLSGLGWCTAFHGLWRHEAVASLQLHSLRHFNAAFDNEFLALAALRGKLVQIPKPILFRLKDSYQREAESIETRFNRLYFNYPSFPNFLPFCTWIHDHCQFFRAVNVPLDRRDELIRQTVSTLLNRYKHIVDYELGRAVNLALTGEFKKGLRVWDEKGVLVKDEPLPPKGQYKYLDFVYLAQLLKDLEYAHCLRPDFPRLALARAVVRLELGQQPEALAALETAFKQNPNDQEVQVLRAKLQSMVHQPKA